MRVVLKYQTRQLAHGWRGRFVGMSSQANTGKFDQRYTYLLELSDSAFSQGFDVRTVNLPTLYRPMLLRLAEHGARSAPGLNSQEVALILSFW